MDFVCQVYTIVAKIPAGKVLSYKDVAERAGSPKASRAVGMAMKKNPDITNVPCHRVVGSDGKMHGYSMGGESIKIEKLKKEGVQFIYDRVDLSKSRWLSSE